MKKVNSKDSNGEITVEKLSKDEIENYKYLISNEVRFAIISAIRTYSKPLNLTKLSKITGYPTTTIIHHIQNLLDKQIINMIKIPKKRGKYYEIDSQYDKIKKLIGMEMETENVLELIETLKKKSLEEYKNFNMTELIKQVENGKLTINSLDLVNSLAMFSKNMTSFSAELFKNIINQIENENKNISLPLSYISIQQTSFSISKIEQLYEFQKIYFTYMKDILEMKKRFDKENKELNTQELEKIYVYFFTTPIIEI